jgi:hypothetical protein
MPNQLLDARKHVISHNEKAFHVVKDLAVLPSLHFNQMSFAISSLRFTLTRIPKASWEALLKSLVETIFQDVDGSTGFIFKK